RLYMSQSTGKLARLAEGSAAASTGMETDANSVGAQARPLGIRLESVVRYLSILAGLGLSLVVIQQYRLENRTFFNVAALTAVGFGISALLPLAYRLPF